MTSHKTKEDIVNKKDSGKNFRGSKTAIGVSFCNKKPYF